LHKIFYTQESSTTLRVQIFAELIFALWDLILIIFGIAHQLSLIT